MTIHSFTPIYMGEIRPWRCGVLFDRSKRYAEAVIRNLQSKASLFVAANVPYQISDDSDYAIPVHGQARGLEAILIEIRQDQIADADGARTWARRIARALGRFSPTLFDTYNRLKQWECAQACANDEATLFARYRAAY